MAIFRSSSWPSLFTALLLATAPTTTLAARMLQSNSLNPCMENSRFSATLFRVVFDADNSKVSIDFKGNSQIDAKVLFDINVIGYGYSAYQKVINPCAEAAFDGALCPMRVAPITLPTASTLPEDAISQVPSIIYSIPDLDGKVRVWINDSITREPYACVEAELQNGKTVQQKAVAWVVAVIAGLALLSSAVVSGLGHSTAAAHIAAYALSLFAFFQSQAIVGMTAITYPPIVRAWTLNFQWSMGIISVGFLQRMATWYQRATGGSPAHLISNLENYSVQVQKRSLDYVGDMLSRRTNSPESSVTPTAVSVQGIERVGFLSKVEITNIFFTGYVIFVGFAIIISIVVILFKYICEGLTRAGKMNPDKFRDFRTSWKTVLKGILIRLVLIGFPQMVILCFWELTRRDSAAEVVLAVSTLLFFFSILAWGTFSVVRIARQSKALHNNPAYMLYSDPKAVDKWGFLYVQYKGGMYYFIIPILFYILFRGLFIAFGQNNGRVQAVGLIVLDAILLTVLSVMKPYMDKKTNVLNIIIASVNFVNSLILLFFTDAFAIPPLGIGALGVIFFLINAVFCLVLVLMVIWASFWPLITKNPETRLEHSLDDRRSFIKSQTNLVNTELDALGATARGDHTDHYANEKNYRTDSSDRTDSHSKIHSKVERY